jgi:hypothetical protein
MTEATKAWNGEVVRRWLERRSQAARLDQAAADRRGYEAQDDYDKAAAEEWMCRALQSPDHIDDQTAFAKRIKELIARDDYVATGIYNDAKFERHVRSHLRKIAKMTKTNKGFEKTLRYQ